MIYIALLRGVNISGKNKIAMNDLKKALEEKYQNVNTYLNSGNVVFESDDLDVDDISADINRIIEKVFRLDIPVFVMTFQELDDILKHSPSWWDLLNKELYNNIIFMLSQTSFKDVYNCLGKPKEEIEAIYNYNRCIFWSYQLRSYRKSTWWVKTASTSIKDMITIRTGNTIVKLHEMCTKIKNKHQ